MASFYHFKKHEYLTFSKQLNNKIIMSQNLKKQLDDLNAKKKKLFLSKDVKKWKLSQQVLNQVDINKVFEDFSKIQ